MWTDEFGNIVRDKESFQPPSKRWQWSDDWSICENINSEKAKSNGWQYATGVNQKYEWVTVFLIDRYVVDLRIMSHGILMSDVEHGVGL